MTKEKKQYKVEWDDGDDHQAAYYASKVLANKKYNKLTCKKKLLVFHIYKWEWEVIRAEEDQI